jgi:hypothetical protein
MTYESHMFKPNPRKVAADKRETLYIVLFIILLVCVWLFLFRGLLTLALLVGLAISIIQLKLSDIKKKGPNRFGSLPTRLSLNSERLIIGDDTLLIADLEKFEIIADDFVGKPGELFAISDGVDNYIEFLRNGVEYSFQFCVRRQSDLKILSQIEKEIRETQGKNV